MADSLETLGSRRHFEHIVVGCGGIGSGALYWLSKRTPGEVLGLEQFELGHDKGGSHDWSRLVRLTNHDERYMQLAPDSYKAWEEVERESGQKLLFRCGGVLLAERGKTDIVLDKIAECMDRHNIPYEILSGKELSSRYPEFKTGPETVALYQKDAGLVDAALANSTHVQLARGNGAVVIDKCPVNRITRNSAGRLEITTTKGTFTCGKLVVTAGAWLNEVLTSIGVHVPVTVTQEQVTYFATPHIKLFTKDKFPVIIYHGANEIFYTLPIHGNSYTKVGLDAGGEYVTAQTRTFVPDSNRVKMCVDLLQRILPKFLGPEAYTKTCLYTMPPDRHFVIDTCASEGFSDVIVCCGAGQAFKSASLLGKILSELATEGETKYDISHFTMHRPALTDPSFTPDFYIGIRPAQSAKL